MAERTRARTIVGIAVMVLLPLLQFQRLSLRGAAGASSSYGHGALSTDTLRRILRALPDATLVAEDASLELLVRAASPRLRAGGQDVRVVPRRAAAVSAALAAGRIFAFPRAQLALQHQGVELSGRAMGIPGVAEVQRVVDCARVGRQWSDAPTLTVAGGFALIARREDARGPVTIYLGSRENLRTAAVGWPARATRGFQVREYARAERPDLADALQAQGIPPSSGVLTAPYVVRIVMWRTPGAADVLPVALSRPPDVALAKGEPDSGWRFLELCPSFRSQPEDIVPPR
jgi:hypothetical protein